MASANSIRAPLFLVAFISLVVMLCGGIVALWSLGSVATRFHDFIETDQARLEAYGGMYAQGLQTGQAIRNVILDPANPKAYTNLVVAQREFGQHLQVARQLAGESGESAVVAELEKLWAANVSMKTRIAELAKGGQIAEAMQLLNRDETPSWRTIKDILLKRQ